MKPWWRLTRCQGQHRVSDGSAISRQRCGKRGGSGCILQPGVVSASRVGTGVILTYVPTSGTPDAAVLREAGREPIPAPGMMQTAYYVIEGLSCIRGERLGVEVATMFWIGSSPHTRGTRRRGPRRVGGRGLIPACAGNTSAASPAALSASAHPRMRGEHEFIVMLDVWSQGSSPHARGTLVV